MKSVAHVLVNTRQERASWLPAPKTGALLAALAIVGLWIHPVTAQEFEPRTYAVTPVGLNFFSIAYGFANGAVFTDPSLPVEDMDARVHAVVARYIRTTEIFNRPAKLKVVLPWNSGHWNGYLEGEFRTRDAAGLGDARVVFETLFSGAEVRSPADMDASASSDTVWGARLQLVLPTGRYESGKVVNMGSNRWGVIPEIGFSHALGKWSLEGAVGTWFFGDNDDYVGGQRLEQDPLLVVKLHLIRPVRPGFWWALATGFGYGGRTTVDGVKRDTIQRNWRFAAMVAYPVKKNQGVIVQLGTGGNHGAGGDFDSIALGYQVAW